MQDDPPRFSSSLHGESFLKLKTCKPSLFPISCPHSSRSFTITVLHYYTAFWFCPALSWGVKLPGNVSSVLLDKAIALDSNPVKLETPVKIPDSGIFARINPRSPVVSKPAGSWRLVDFVKVLTKSE